MKLSCPHCGASIMRDTPICEVCNSTVEWKNGFPKHPHKHMPKVTLVMLTIILITISIFVMR